MMDLIIKNKKYLISLIVEYGKTWDSNVEKVTEDKSPTRIYIA